MTEPREIVKEKRVGRKLSIFNFLLTLATIGGGVYLYQEQKTAVIRANAFDTSINENTKSFSVVEDKLAQLEKKYLDAEQVNKLVAAAAAKLDDKKMDEDAVKKAIQTALETYAGGSLPRVDLTKEIEQWKEIRDENKAMTEAIKKDLANSEALASKTKEEISELFAAEKEKLTASIKSHANPGPLLSSLTMADIAAKGGNYKSTVNYLNEALQAFDIYNLNKDPYLQFKEPLHKLIADFKELADEPTPAQQLNEILDTVDVWPFKEDNSKPAVEPKDVAKEEGVWAKTKAIAGNVVASTVKVTKNADRSLAWVNRDENLQNIIRQNVRLDLSFGRNALQVGDYDSYEQTANGLSEQIQRYFNTEDKAVAAALKKLEQLKTAKVKLPDIGALVQKVEQAKGE